MPELTNEQLAEIETTLRINERPVREIAPDVHDAATDLLAEVRRLRAENERLQAVKMTPDEWSVVIWREAKIEAMRDGGEG